MEWFHMKQALVDASTQARLSKRPAPVIKSDLHTIMVLAAALAEEIGCRVGDLRTPDHPTAKYMFDGIKFEVE
jgi:hypothetical protein